MNFNSYSGLKVVESIKLDNVEFVFKVYVKTGFFSKKVLFEETFDELNFGLCQIYRFFREADIDLNINRGYDYLATEIFKTWIDCNKAFKTYFTLSDVFDDIEVNSDLGRITIEINPVEK